MSSLENLKNKPNSSSFYFIIKTWKLEKLGKILA